MRNLLHRLGPIAVGIILTGSLWLLYHELEHYHIRDIRQAISQIATWRLWLAMGLTIVNYVVLIAYDYMAVRSIGHPLPLGRIALASFTGFVTSYNFGPLLGGTSVRYRLYSAWELSGAEIARLIVMLGITFWVGVFALAGVVFVAQPFAIPDGTPIPFHNVRPLGFILLALTSAYVALTAVRTKPLCIRGHLLTMPTARTTALQLAIAASDLLVAAACLYVLVAHDVNMDYTEFLGIYLLAVVATVVTHVPGGIGVFELTVLTFARTNSSASLVAALLVFRAVYYLLPLLLAVLLLAANEIILRRRAAERLWSGVSRWSLTITPTLLAVTTLLAGAVLLLSGVTPVEPSRLAILTHTIPLPLLETSHFLASLVGTSLLLLACGLQRRLDSAWWLAAGLLVVGMVASLLKGLDFEEASLLAVVLIALVTCRRQFYRSGSLTHERFTPGWVSAILLAVACSIWLGLFTHKHLEFSNDIWWRFAFQADAPRFLRASVGVTAVLLLFVIWKLLRPGGLVVSLPSASEIEAAVPIVKASSHTSANLALLGDKALLFNNQRTAFIMYAVQGRSWVAMGDPIGPGKERAELVWAFRGLVDRYDAWPVFYQVDESNVPIYVDQGLTLVKLGEVARVPLAEFRLEGAARKGLRQARKRCERECCQFEVVPADAVARLLPELRDVSDAWLRHKQVTENGFSLGFFDDEYLARFSCAVIRRSGSVIAFANVWCSAEKEELSIDLMRYRPGSPSGVMDYLLIELMLWGRQREFRWFDLGMAPLSGMEDRHLAPLWNRAVNLVYRHGDHFYSFEGLRNYKQKFDPVWTPKYLASPGGLALPMILTNVTTLISGRSPLCGS